MPNRLWMLLLCGLFTPMLLLIGQRGLSSAEAAASTKSTANSNTATTPHLLAIYALSFDNPPTLTNSLAPLLVETVSLLTGVTADNPNISVAIIADGGGFGDTLLYTASNGVATPFAALPDSSGDLDATLTEYNMTDGATLGGFILWARKQLPATLTTFTYMGHGLPVTPWTGQPINNTSYDMMDGDGTRSGGLNPLPLRWCLNGAGTDHSLPDQDPDAFNMISPYAIGEALRIGTQDGSNPIDVFDSMHCFAQSIEQLYEVAGDDGHNNLYVRATVGSPSYAYFAPELLPSVLEQLTVDATTTYSSIASAMVDAYHSLHEPESSHPHAITAVDNANLETVKSEWASVAERLVANAQIDPTTTWTRLLAAYNTTRKYDTSVCEGEQDYALEAPDALVNFPEFALAILNQYDNDPVLDLALLNAANAAYFATTGSVIHERGSDGTPHFGNGGTPWSVDTSLTASTTGISLFAPLQSMVVSGTAYLPFQALWYTQSVTIGVGTTDVPNPQPLRFFDSSTANWQALIATYWDANNLTPGVDVETIFCTSELPTFRDSYADLRVTITDTVDPVASGELVTYTVDVMNGGVRAARLTELLVSIDGSTLEFVSATPSAVCEGGTACALEFDLGSLDVDESVTVIILARAKRLESAIGAVRASVSSSSAESLTFNDTATEETIIGTVPTAITLHQQSNSVRPFAIALTLGAVILLTLVCLKWPNPP